MNISVSVKNSMLEGFCNNINLGIAKLLLTDGTNDFVLLDLPSPIQSSITGGKLIFNTIPQALVGRSGEPTLAYIMVNNSIEVTLDVGTDLILEKPLVQAGGYLNIQSLSISI